MDEEHDEEPNDEKGYRFTSDTLKSGARNAGRGTLNDDERILLLLQDSDNNRNQVKRKILGKGPDMNRYAAASQDLIDAYTAIQDSSLPDKSKTKYLNLVLKRVKDLKEKDKNAYAMVDEYHTRTIIGNSYLSLDEIEREIGGNVNKERRRESPSGKLEKAAATAALIGIVGGAFFLSSNITGNVIGIGQPTGNIFGIILLVIGLLSGLFWFRKRN